MALSFWVLGGGVTSSQGVSDSPTLELLFYVVPQEAWRDGNPDLTQRLEEGEVWLYRSGEAEPAFVLPVNQPAEVPAGSWTWIVQAPGYASVLPGQLSFEKDSVAGVKRLIWPVVPACRLVLQLDRRWLGTSRFDAVSLDHQTVYSIDPKKRRTLWVPAGRYLSYRVGGRGIEGIGRPRRCSSGQTVQLSPPEPPSENRQDLLFHLQLPPEAADLDRSQLLASTQPAQRGSSGSVEPPAAILWNGRIGSFFFLDVPAQETRLFSFEHPALLTAQERLPAQGGSVRELPPLELEPRPSLEVQVDYRPQRPHRQARLMGYACGSKRRQTDYPRRLCRKLVTEHSLVPGVAGYRFEGLDRGQYFFDAQVDEETVQGLGNHYGPYVEPGGSPEISSPVLPLRELEIYGHLLEDGEPVPGEVRLRAAESLEASQRVFPTGEDLFYRLFFFGHLPNPALTGLPRLIREREGEAPEKLRGLYQDGYTLEACDDRGACRLLSWHSVLLGEGRLDLDLSTDHELSLEVVDRGSGDPLSTAMVGLGSEPALVFFHGEVEWRDAGSAEPLFTYTDAQGRAHLRALASPQNVTIAKEGYETWRRRVALESKTPRSLRVELDAKEESPREGVRVELPVGRPLAQAYFLALDREGRRDLRCSAATDSRGVLEIPAGCWEGKQVVVLHPEARIEAYPGELLASTGSFRVEPAPEVAPVVRVLDAEGKPRSTPVELRFGTFTLGPNDLLAAASFGGQLLFYRTDSAGELELRGVDPQGPDVPAVLIPGDGDYAPRSLAGVSPGEVVEIFPRAN